MRDFRELVVENARAEKAAAVFRGRVSRDLAVSEYSAFINRSANAAEPSALLRNQIPDHASIVFENIFRTSQSYVKILTGAMNSDVYGTPAVIRGTLAFLRRSSDAIVDILHEREIDFSAHPWFRAVNNENLNDQISVARIDLAVQTRYTCHFCVADGCNYRFEADKTSHEAFVQFGDTAFASSLESVFDKLKTYSRKEQLFEAEKVT